jgi:quercetin dioxygenase-like cupin family protein
MIRALALPAAVAALACAASATAQPAPSAAPSAAPVTTALKRVEATSSGQPIVMPKGPLRVTVSETTIPPHGSLPVHKHPYPRYVYVLSGRVRVTNLDTGQAAEFKAGDMTIDPIGQWHKAQALGEEGARLITVDQAPPGAQTTVLREP